MNSLRDGWIEIDFRPLSDAERASGRGMTHMMRARRGDYLLLWPMPAQLVGTEMDTLRQVLAGDFDKLEHRLASHEDDG